MGKYLVLRASEVPENKRLGGKNNSRGRNTVHFSNRTGQVNISTLCFLHTNQRWAGLWLLFCSRDFQTQLCQHDLILTGSSSPWIHQRPPCVKHLLLLLVVLLTDWNSYPMTNHPEPAHGPPSFHTPSSASLFTWNCADICGFLFTSELIAGLCLWQKFFE